MSVVSRVGETKITHDSIKKHFTTTSPLDAVCELIWNGFDAKAKNVSVTVTRTSLEGLDVLTVLDDGEGIDFERIDDHFGVFDDSTKKDSIDQRGTHGRGRLAFHRLASRGRWFTKRLSGEAKITIDAGALKTFATDFLTAPDSHRQVAQPSGTKVILDNILPGKNLEDAETIGHLGRVFGWYLALNPGKRLTYNGTTVSIPEHEFFEHVLEARGRQYPVKIIRWEEKPLWEKSYIYVNGANDATIHNELSKLNNKPDFYVSLNLQTDWPREFLEEPGLLSTEEAKAAHEAWPQLLRQLNVIARKVYESFLDKHVEEQIARYEEEGVFPTYTDEPSQARWRLDNTKDLVRTILVTDPAVLRSLNKKQKKIVVRLLDRLSVSDENHALFDVLSGVLDLDDESTQRLAAQLKHTTLANIVSTIELLQRRQSAIEKIRRLMDAHHKEVLETPDLQQIIENNTWLFGPQYETLGAEEDTFTVIAKDLRDKIKGVNTINSDDVDEEAHIDGALRQPDLFLARKVSTFDSNGKRYFRCVLVEIKRPSVALGTKHIRQLDDYAAIIKRHPSFSSDHMRFELLLLGRKISDRDFEIRDRMNQMLAHQEIGLVATSPGMKRYVLNWYTLLDGWELTHQQVLEALKLKRELLTGQTKDSLVEDLQSPIAA